jgi:hypothetical protein
MPATLPVLRNNALLYRAVSTKHAEGRRGAWLLNTALLGSLNFFWVSVRLLKLKQINAASDAAFDATAAAFTYAA